MAKAVPAVQVSVAILELLAREWPSQVSANAIIAELGLNKSTCYNILQTLAEAGWVSKPGNRKGFQLGERLLELSAVPTGRGIYGTGPVLEALARAIGLSVFVAERDTDLSYVAIMTADTDVGVRVSIAEGNRFPFSAPALLQAFEAWNPPELVQQRVYAHGLTVFTQFSIASFEDLEVNLEHVRSCGYSASYREYDLSQSGIAAPIFDAHGEVRYALCALGFSSVVGETRVREVGPILRDAADQISKRIAGKPAGDTGFVSRQE